MSKALDVSNLTIAYGEIAAVREVSFTVEAGEIATIIGANGAGKTTILNALCGLRDVRSGSIRLGEDDITALPPHERVRHGLSQVPEGRRLFGRMSVAENLEIGAYARRDHAARRHDLDHVLELFPRLRERYRQLAGTLSGGEQQMVAMGRALMTAPKVLLLDEPTMGLAPQIVDLVIDAVRRVNGEGVTVLLVEQNAYSALEIADRAFVLESGEITLTGNGPDLITHPRVRSAYLGYDA
ncbi:branched-chain amino acid transport system ATP-binding protein [Angulomicrobium tetraedrale]|uniref:Branched-chain amino acid transport system ATP-binding protein n=1 Tax=Ancylobacter tetraedralis TaxID=217068 RepID=A0A839Z951_9HYPH|nr:ABC transporter ATP-binding protein [Ancylobacter tetraedralis]MBB3771188.1 branched-chain amino acid transport system ATP-binding protein [Ancylobacter tetraedralis]